jgi:hypothetical protein
VAPQGWACRRAIEELQRLDSESIARAERLAKGMKSRKRQLLFDGLTPVR